MQVKIQVGATIINISKKSYLTLTKLIKRTFLFMSHLYFSKIVPGKSLIKLLDIFVDFQIFYGKKISLGQNQMPDSYFDHCKFQKTEFQKYDSEIEGN